MAACSVFLSLLALFRVLNENARVLPVATLNDRPIIGIAVQETSEGNPQGDSYISAPYVKYLEQSGARVVPVRVGESEDYYTDLFFKLNGLLFPGGRVNAINSLHARTASIFYNLTLQAAERGDFFPLWGTCLGFQLFATITAGRRIRTVTKTRNMILPLNFLPAYRNSRMLGQFPEDVLIYLQKAPVARHNHLFGVPMRNFHNKTELENFYNVLSTSVARNGIEFATMFEAFKYPIYGTQWHPERNAFYWKPDVMINHNKEAIRAAQYFANFFVNEARKSSHRFPSMEEEIAALIDNFRLEVTKKSRLEIYFFNFTDRSIRTKRAIV